MTHCHPFMLYFSNFKTCRGRMGKKHSTSKPGGGRTNAIFKIAGANFKEKKSNNKPKEVTSKLKTVSSVCQYCDNGVMQLRGG